MDSTRKSQRKNSHRHVFGRPSESARTRADELAGNAEVTKLDYALAREEDIRGLDVPVDDFLRVQVRQALQDLSSGFPDNTQITKSVRRTRGDKGKNKGGGERGKAHDLLPPPRSGRPSPPRGPSCA